MRSWVFGTRLSIGDVSSNAECRIKANISNTYQENKGDCKEEDALSDLYFERGKQSFNFVAKVLVFGAF